MAKFGRAFRQNWSTCGPTRSDNLGHYFAQPCPLVGQFWSFVCPSRPEFVQLGPKLSSRNNSWTIVGHLRDHFDRGHDALRVHHDLVRDDEALSALGAPPTPGAVRQRHVPLGRSSRGEPPGCKQRMLTRLDIGRLLRPETCSNVVVARILQATSDESNEPLVFA